ncbi:hypothetical protein GCM10008096_13220 [Zhihengliuella salsuginis]|uniref:Uncharacterized protein n=1 Tax=Zhihengliuella salsuginis TaxID=578222 RepID=A0ABQ3GI40_9MICC|nr:hypothetical protein GCM10008096_13220 [Zhihengliuella salsuginis]
MVVGSGLGVRLGVAVAVGEGAVVVGPGVGLISPSPGPPGLQAPSNPTHAAAATAVVHLLLALIRQDKHRRRLDGRPGRPRLGHDPTAIPSHERICGSDRAGILVAPSWIPVECQPGGVA